MTAYSVLTGGAPAGILPTTQSRGRGLHSSESGATSSWLAATARLGILSKASARTARVNSLSNALRQGRFLTSLPIPHSAQLELPELCVVAEISHCLRLSV